MRLARRRIDRLVPGHGQSQNRSLRVDDQGRRADRVQEKERGHADDRDAVRVQDLPENSQARVQYVSDGETETAQSNSDRERVQRTGHQEDVEGQLRDARIQAARARGLAVLPEVVRRFGPEKQTDGQTRSVFGLT